MWLRPDKGRLNLFDMEGPGLEQGSLLDRFKHVSASKGHTGDRWSARGLGATFRLERQVPATCVGPGFLVSDAIHAVEHGPLGTKYAECCIRGASEARRN